MHKTALPKTTIWKNDDGIEVKIGELAGLPFGAPKIGTSVNHAELGEIICVGIDARGSGANAQVVEVRWRVA